jgi:flagella basal body P-ring formation protein FlgA
MFGRNIFIGIALFFSLLKGVGWTFEISKEQLYFFAKKKIKSPYILLNITLYANSIKLPDKPLSFDVVKKGNSFYLVITDLTTGRSVYIIPLKVGVKKRVVVAKTTIKPGEILSPKNTGIKEKIFNYEPNNVFFNLANVWGKIAKTYIKAGRVIKKEQISEPYLVKSGQRVKIIFQYQNIEVIAYGTALQNGKKGEIIRVRRKNKIFLGRVENENTVVVQLY